MESRTLVKVIVAKNCLAFRTISRTRKSPQNFYILRESFEELENLLNPAVTVSDIRSYAEMRRNIPKNTVDIRFCWLCGCEDQLSGWAETVTLPYDDLIRLARNGTQGEVWSVLSLQENGQPRLVFSSKRNLRAAAGNKLVRHKLAKCLRGGFRFYDETIPYSFFFREIRCGQPGICGGLILHGQEDMSKAYYSVHT